ncbi:MAG: GntR family transcriptional regulator [Spirochaetales bacterium]|nr:GntR family transcriptional regulator [Spirochaetales bacterium]
MSQEKNPTKNDAYNAIQKQIQEGELAPGDWLVERDLCDQFGLSRTPMREVLWHLEKDGLLIQSPGRGFRVRELNLQEIMEIFQAREAVEGMAAFLVSHLHDQAFFDVISELRKELESLKDDELQETGPQIGARMHSHIISHANNSILKGFYTKLKNMYSLTVNITRRSREIEMVSRDSHLAIMKAIEDRNGELAEKLMREHLRETCRDITKIFYPNLI